MKNPEQLESLFQSLASQSEQAVRSFRSRAETKLASGFFSLQDQFAFRTDIGLANQALGVIAERQEVAVQNRFIEAIKDAFPPAPVIESMPIETPVIKSMSFCPIFGDSGV